MKKVLVVALGKAFPLVHKAQGKKLEKMTDEEVLNLLLNTIQAEVKRLAGVEAGLKKVQDNLSEGSAKLTEDQEKLSADHQKLSDAQVALAEDSAGLDQEREALALRWKKLDSEVERLGPLSKIAPAGAAFDRKWLKDLTFRGRREGKPKEKDGRKIKTFVPFERGLEEGDILSWRDCGAEVILVTADGQKVTVEK